jgi:hydrolase, NUDIX family
MNEMMSTTEQKLWYDGPNYTADSIVIHPESRQVLLVKRKTGEWALPGGFIDPGEEPLTAAHREVMEETVQLLAVIRPLCSVDWLTTRAIPRLPG